MSMVGQITERTNQQHIFEVPCVIALRIADGNPAYLQWIAGELHNNVEDVD